MPIRILVLAAHPAHREGLALGKESRAIKAAIRDAKYHDSVVLRFEWAVRPSDVVMLLDEYRPHIVHFYGHGGPDESLMLEDDEGDAKPVSAHALTEMFRVGKHDVCLVVFNLCSSLTLADAIREHIDCTIGVEGFLSDEVAVVFAACLYRAIVSGGSIGNAFKQGRAAIMAEGLSTGRMPELLTRSLQDGASINADELVLLPREAVNHEDNGPGTVSDASSREWLTRPSQDDVSINADELELLRRGVVNHDRKLRSQGTPESTLPGRLWRVPDLPPHHLPRPEHIEPLIEALLTDGRAVGIAGKHGVHGMGGIGKSVLAAVVARSPEIRARFADGIYWLDIGQEPHITILQAQLARALGVEAAFEHPADGKSKLAELLAGKRVLVVLDDVWDPAHATGLEVIGAEGRVLITTRNLEVLTYRGAKIHDVDVLSVDQSLALLSQWIGSDVKELPSEAKDVVTACGCLPLALAMVGALVQMGSATWARVLEWLSDGRLTKIKGKVPEYPYRNVYKAIEVSVQALEADEDLDVASVGMCYRDLAVFAEDEAIPCTALRVLWGRYGLDDADVDELAASLAARALARKEIHSVDWSLRLHDLQRAYVRACTEDMGALHGAFVDAYAARCPEGLTRGPAGAVDEYFFARLPLHLLGAGREHKLHELLWTYDWLDAKLRATGPAEVVADFDLIECNKALARLSQIWGARVAGTARSGPRSS